MRKWWNWQTHHLEGVAPKGVGVQIPPSAPVINLYPMSYERIFESYNNRTTFPPSGVSGYTSNICFLPWFTPLCAYRGTRARKFPISLREMIYFTMWWKLSRPGFDAISKPHARSCPSLH